MWFDKSDGDVPYDVVHVAGVLAVCLLVMGVLFWALWALIVHKILAVKAVAFLILSVLVVVGWKLFHRFSPTEK